MVGGPSSAFHPPENHPEYPHVMASVARMREAFGEAPEVAFVLGSGLGPLIERVTSQKRVSYPDLELPSSAVVGHAGEMVVGELGGRRVALMSGRVHMYEGHPAAHVVRGVRALGVWGVRTLVLTNSAGAVARGLHPGDLVVLRDHINFLGTSPLVGPAWGDRFPDPTAAYPQSLLDSLQAAASQVGVTLHEGIYAAMLGPAYETPAEIRMLARLGVDVVGMSTVPEVLAALEMGVKVTAVSVVSNYASGVVQGSIDHSQVTVVAGKASLALCRVFEAAAHEL